MKDNIFLKKIHRKMLFWKILEGKKSLANFRTLQKIVQRFQTSKNHENVKKLDGKSNLWLILG